MIDGILRMWDIYSINYNFRGAAHNYCDPAIVKQFSEIKQMIELPSLTNWELFKSIDGFLPLRHGNVLHGSSETILKNMKKDAETTYPLIHDSIYTLLCEFLHIKLEHGTEKEKAVYHGMSACDLVDRLLTKRCATYYGRNENYKLANGATGQGDFSKVGTDMEVSPLTMDQCLTRDEIKLTGFLLISSQVTKTIGTKTTSVISVGIPFPIFNREGLFEWEDCMVTRRQNIPDKGYGPPYGRDCKQTYLGKYRKMWDNFYGSKNQLFNTQRKRSSLLFSPSRHEKEEDRLHRYLKLPNMTFVDIQRVTIRLSVITVAILAEAEKRARDAERMTCVVVDRNKIGLSKVPKVFTTVFMRNLAYEVLGQYRYLCHIQSIILVDFPEISSLEKDSLIYLSDGVFGNRHPNEGIEIKYMSKSEYKAESLSDEYLIVETYRLDHNALPGNELWMSKVSKDRSDPSFDVRHSAIPFIHNPFINRTRLCGGNLRAYSHYGVFNWTDIHAVNY